MNTENYQKILTKMTEEYTKQMKKSKSFMEQERIDSMQTKELPYGFRKLHIKPFREIWDRYDDFIGMIRETKLLSYKEIMALDNINDSLFDSFKDSVRYEWNKMKEELEKTIGL